MSDSAPRSTEPAPEAVHSEPRDGHAAATPETPGTTEPAPRSLRRRLEVSAATARQAARPTRVRSRPLEPPARSAPQRERAPVPLEWEPEPLTTPWRAKPLVIALAGLAWLVALALLLADPRRAGSPWELRLLVALIWATAAALTFVPIQWRLALPGLGWQGILGWTTLGYLLAFAPAPRGWLLDLPDLPVYLLLFFAVFYAVTAAALPLTYLLGQRVYRLRIHRLDVRRARRQAYELGVLAVAALALAGLRVLTPATFGLLVVVIALTEALLLSQMRPQA